LKTPQAYSPWTRLLGYYSLKSIQARLDKHQLRQSCGDNIQEGQFNTYCFL
jgi:hypothetical protein